MFYTDIEANYKGTIETIKFVLKHKDYISSADFNYFGEESRYFFSRELNFMVWGSLRRIVSSEDYKSLYESAELEVLVKYLLLTIIFKYKGKYMKEVELVSYRSNSYSLMYYFEYDGKVYNVRTMNEARMWLSTVKIDGEDVCLWEIGNVLMYYTMNDVWRNFHLVYEKDLKSFRRALATGIVETDERGLKPFLSVKHKGEH